MTASRLVSVRLSNAVVEKAKKKACQLGYIQPSGEANLSEYIRNLIINDRR